LPRKGNPYVRVWEDVWAIYRGIAKKHGLKISDLVSIVLMYAPVFSPLSVVVGLEDNYDISRQEALEIAFDLKDLIESVVRAAEEAREKKVEQVIELMA